MLLVQYHDQKNRHLEQVNTRFYLKENFPYHKSDLEGPHEDVEVHEQCLYPVKLILSLS